MLFAVGVQVTINMEINKLLEVCPSSRLMAPSRWREMTTPREMAGIMSSFPIATQMFGVHLKSSGMVATPSDRVAPSIIKLIGTAVCKQIRMKYARLWGPLNQFLYLAYFIEGVEKPAERGIVILINNVDQETSNRRDARDCKSEKRCKNSRLRKLLQERGRISFKVGAMRNIWQGFRFWIVEVS